MIFIPFHEHDKRRTVLAVVIEPDNLARMQKGDPITIESAGRGGMMMPYLPYPMNTSLLIAYEADSGRIYELAEREDIQGLFAYLERGREFKEGVDGWKPISIKGPKRHD
jgi:hypothetical protein